jgi:hypothetical protein
MYAASYLCNFQSAISDNKATLLGTVCSLAVIGLWGIILLLISRYTVKHNNRMVFSYWISILIISGVSLLLRASEISLPSAVEGVLFLFLPILFFVFFTPLYGVRCFSDEVLNSVIVLYLIWVGISLLMIALEILAVRKIGEEKM